MAGQLMFYTVNDGNGASNPHSVELLRALQREGDCDITILTDLSQSKIIEKHMIAVFDSSRRVNTFSPVRPKDDEAPAWAKNAECGICVGPGCVGNSAKLIRAARQISKMFSSLPVSQIPFRKPPKGPQTLHRPHRERGNWFFGHGAW